MLIYTGGGGELPTVQGDRIYHVGHHPVEELIGTCTGGAVHERNGQQGVYIGLPIASFNCTSIEIHTHTGHNSTGS